MNIKNIELTERLKIEFRKLGKLANAVTWDGEYQYEVKTIRWNTIKGKTIITARRN